MGRHREFDAEQALDAALEVFWQKGFEGASFEDLTHATGVARKGLYVAFGNKEALFRKALDRYRSTYMTTMRDALAEPTAHKVIQRVLEGSIDVFTLNGEARGCLGLNGALACSDDAEPIRQELIIRRNATEAVLLARLKTARQEGDLPTTADCETLASYIITLIQGLAVQAKAGASRTKLRAIVQHVLAAFLLLEPEINPSNSFSREPAR